MPDESSYWDFSFKLSKNVDYAHDLPQINGIEIKSKIENDQKSITGFSVKVESEIESEGMKIAQRKAQKFADLLSILSGTSLEYPVCNVGMSNGTIVSKSFSSKWSINNNLDSSISEEQWNKIFDSNNKKLVFVIRRISGLLHNHDSISVIRDLDFLIQYLGEPYTNEFKKYRTLRNIISHYNINDLTSKQFNFYFKNDDFEFTDDNKLDFLSSINLEKLNKYSQEFLKKMISLIIEKIKKV